MICNLLREIPRFCSDRLGYDKLQICPAATSVSRIGPAQQHKYRPFSTSISIRSTLRSAMPARVNHSRDLQRRWLRKPANIDDGDGAAQPGAPFHCYLRRHY